MPTAPATRAERTTHDDDLATQAAVLGRLAELHPERLTLEELLLELAGEEPDFAATDAIERACSELSGAGLVHLRGGFVSLTRAASRYTELLER